MSRWQNRIARIKTEISITDLLSDYGYRVRPDGGDREQQFSCDLHGDGRDNKPSSRAYPSSASWYCFACDKTRDAIETVREKEGLDFKEAVSFLEKKYNLPSLPWDDDDTVRTRPKPTTADEVGEILERKVSFSDRLKTTYANLRGITTDRELPMDKVLAFWEATDTISWLVKQGEVTEEKGIATLLKIRDKIREAENPV